MRVEGREVTLDGGVQPFDVHVPPRPAAAAARVELFWQGRASSRSRSPTVPRPPAQGPAGRVRQRPAPRTRPVPVRGTGLREVPQAGRERRDGEDARRRTGPNLTDVAKRAYPGWIDAWLADPAKLRPHTTMPKMFADDERGRAERYAVTQIPRLARPAHAARTVPPAGADLRTSTRQSIERGRVLYHRHRLRRVPSGADAEEGRSERRGREREPLKPEDYVYSLGHAPARPRSTSSGRSGARRDPRRSPRTSRTR